MGSKVTPEEEAAAQELGEAILRFITAHEEGREQRQRPHAALAEARTDQPEVEQAVPEQIAPITPEKLLLTAREAARALSVSVRTLYTLTEPRGPIPSVKLRSGVRYSPDDLKGWIEQAKRKKQNL